MAHVLIGFGEALPVAEVIFSLRRAGHEVSVFARTEAHPARRLPLRAWRRVPAPEVDAAGTVQEIRRLASELAPDVILPLDDAGLWAVDACGFEERQVAGATGRLAMAALDKTIQLEVARQAGLRVPDTHVVRRREDLDGLPFSPAIAKPALAVRLRSGRLGKAGTVFLDSAADVVRLADSWDAEEGPLLLQPLLSGTGEGLFGLAHANGVAAWSAHRRLRMVNPHGSGSSACEAVPIDPDLQARVWHFVRALGWRGPFMIEFLRDAQGTPWFMELNGRMWGSMALARRQGLEYPAWAVAGALDPGFVPAPAQAAGGPTAVRDLGRDLLHLLLVLRGARSGFHRATWPRLWPTVRAVLRPSRGAAFYNYDPDHPGYFLHQAAWTLRRAFRKR